LGTLILTDKNEEARKQLWEVVEKQKGNSERGRLQKTPVD